MNEFDDEDNGFIDNRCAFSLLRRLVALPAFASVANGGSHLHAGKIKYNEHVHVKQ